MRCPIKIGNFASGATYPLGEHDCGSGIEPDFRLYVTPIDLSLGFLPSYKVLRMKYFSSDMENKQELENHRTLELGKVAPLQTFGPYVFRTESSLLT